MSETDQTLSLKKKKDKYIEPFLKRWQKEQKNMLSILFAIFMIWFIFKLGIFGIRASWGILKLLCTVVFFPVILIALVIGGLIYIALPILIVGGIIALIASKA